MASKTSTRRRRISDDELRALCEQELTSATGDSADLADERASAMDLYLGQPLGDEVEGRSQIRTREVLETVEWILPSLMRVFADADNICVFDPEGPEDEESAQQETESISHTFWRQNRGFYNLYSFVKDGLLQKTGILKVWWDPTPEDEREEYEALNDWELAQLLGDPNVDVDVLEHEMNDDGTHKITIVSRRSNGCLRIEPCPPEEFGIDRDARTIYPDDAQFVFHRTRKTKAELVEAGYTRKLVEELPAAADVLTLERDARRHLSDEQERDFGDHWSLERVWITECYLRVDRDDDGIAELLKVTLAGADSSYTSGSTLLDVEEVDRQPFVCWSPIVLTHKFYGLSVVDLVDDLQAIKTTLARQILDNTYLANNGRTAVNEQVNLDDLLTSRPGGIVRTAGMDPPSQHIMPMPQQPVPPQTFELMSYLDDSRQRRVGVGEEVGALETNSLANVNTGVAALAFDAARSKIELMARLCAEIGLRPLFLRMHELLRKNGGKALAMRLNGRWVQVSPQAWRERADMAVQVGVGRVSRERRLVALSDVLEKQALAVQGGGLGVLLTPVHLYRAASDYTRELGLEESLYWQDPEQAQPLPPQPDPNAQALELQARVAAGQIQVQSERNQVEAAKVASQERIRMAELVQKEAEIHAKAQIEQLKADLVELRSERDTADKAAKQVMDAEIAAREHELRAAELRLKDQQEAAKRESELYKALLQSGTALTQEQIRIAGAGDGAAVGLWDDMRAQMRESISALSEALRAEVGEVRAQLIEQGEAARAPKAVEYDERGLIRSIGGSAVTRDASGRVVQIG